MIHYKQFYKYQLAESYAVQLPFGVSKDVRTPYIDFTSDRLLIVKEGYAWDGASGPVIDTQANMRGSLVHDALYQLMRQEALRTETYRDLADQVFRDIVIADGVNSWRAYIWYYGLRWFGKPAASPHSRKETREAP
jgi:hypothetical protein